MHMRMAITISKHSLQADSFTAGRHQLQFLCREIEAIYAVFMRFSRLNQLKKPMNTVLSTNEIDTERL